MFKASLRGDKASLPVAGSADVRWSSFRRGEGRRFRIIRCCVQGGEG